MKKDEVFGNLHASVSTIKIADNTLRKLEEAGQTRLTMTEIMRIMESVNEIAKHGQNMISALNKFKEIAKK